MDKREAREYIGTNHHFNPSLNPGTPPKKSWFPHLPQHKRHGKAQPIQIERQVSSSSDGTASPSASPSTTSPTFSFPKTDDKATHEHKPKIFKSFDFGN